MIVVMQGLKMGEKVIVEGFQRIQQGVQVSAKPYTDTSETQGAQGDSEKNSSGETKANTGQKPGGTGG